MLNLSRKMNRIHSKEMINRDLWKSNNISIYFYLLRFIFHPRPILSPVVALIAFSSFVIACNLFLRWLNNPWLLLFPRRKTFYLSKVITHHHPESKYLLKQLPLKKSKIRRKFPLLDSHWELIKSKPLL